MCGIVAYSGKSDRLVGTLISGLKHLEYRGYDSAGIALISGDAIYSQKTAGKVSILEEAVGKHPPKRVGNVGIAHTRWATHGAATVENAHPHRSADGKIRLVHNGIIENYQQLKDKLVADGVRFESDTDSEVIAKLVGELYDGDLRKAVLGAIGHLRGAFAFCVISKDEPERLIGVKMASPLIAGIGEGEIIIASDVSAIVDHTKTVVYLEDGELIDAQGDSYAIYDFKGSSREEPLNNVDWYVETASKAGFDHFLLKEIMEQPFAARETIRGRLLIEEAGVKFGGLMDIEARIKNCNRIVLLGVGTSYYAAKLGELYLNALTSFPTIAVMSPEYRYASNPIDKNTWLIAISQSGETADTIAAVEAAKRKGALVTSIVNVVGSTLARISDAGTYNHIGPEISVASTKAFTSQALLLLMHAIPLGRLHGLDRKQASDILAAIEALPTNIEKVLDGREAIERVAKSFKENRDLLYIGRQYNYPIALEGALKMKELAYVHAEGLSGGELKHGFIALVDGNTPTVAIATEDTVIDKMLANIAEVRARNGRVIGIANRAYDVFDETILVPKAGSVFLQPIVNNVALQLLAYYAAKQRGCNIDQPRNLAKSVTVE